MNINNIGVDEMSEAINALQAAWDEISEASKKASHDDGLVVACAMIARRIQRMQGPIPETCYWSDGNFYNLIGSKGMGTEFYEKWRHRHDEFPQSAGEAFNALRSARIAVDRVRAYAEDLRKNASGGDNDPKVIEVARSIADTLLEVIK